MRRVLLLLALALVACGPAPTPISGFFLPSAQLSVEIKDDSRSLKAFGGALGDTCTTLDARAVMNGVPLEQVWAGGMRQELESGPWGFPQWYDRCRSPEWKLPDRIPDEPVTEFEVRDQTGRLLLGAMQLGATRTLTWISPASGAPRWGDLVSLQWTPATDPLEPGYPQLVAGSRSMNLQTIGTPDYRFSDGVLTFRLPDAPPDQGSTDFDGELQLRELDVPTGISHCEPVQGNCSVRITVPDSRVSVPISVRS
jgi:hypothetical protein